MILSLFKKPSPVPGALYAAAMEGSRAPWIYAEASVPDTMDGRFEMFTLHLFLVMRRMKAEPSLGDLVQEVVDLSFAQLDLTLRETGVGDLSVPKKMKALAQRFYGRVAAYEPAMAADDATELTAAIARIVFPEGGSGDPGRLAAYSLAAARHLDAIPASDFLAGRLSFPQG